MTEAIRLSQSTGAIALTLIAAPVSDRQINLALDVQFTEAEFPLSAGKVKYGLIGGTLTLNLQNAYFTSFSQEIANCLPVVKFPTADDPSWQFALAAGLDILQANANAIPLGTATATAENWSVDAALTIGKADLLITEVEGLWRHDLRPNKQAILHRKIALFLLENCLPSPLISLANQKPSPSNVDASPLLTMVENIKTASTDNFLQLCEMADLNPQSDFAGANLRGTTLRGLDFSGANWSRVNLRGADLTDIDVSEGSLQGAKFSGADLSGAYLSNANLQQTDFHRASLALANLSGANLQGANLQEANLTQTNLNDCNLEGTKFD